MGIRAPIDKHGASGTDMGLRTVQLMTNRHIMEVFVYMDESKEEREIHEIAKNRAEKHALNALALLKGKTELTKYAGTGKRQGREDAGPVKLK